MNNAPSAHPTRQALTSFGLGTLDNPSAEAVSKHLEQCTECRKQVAELSADSFVGRARDAQVPAITRYSQSQTSGSTFGPVGHKTAAPPPAHTLPPGLVDHPDYEIKRELGRGGMGVVYLAHNNLLGRDEVLKVVGRHIVDRSDVLNRFMREIRSVARLRHPNIVTGFHASRIGDDIILSMEYVEGLDLARLVKAKGPLTVAQACNFIYQAALGLQHAHEEGIVHRDVKPSNLMLARKGDTATIKILDFGLAKAIHGKSFDSALTADGQTMGTPDFIAPEQIRDAQSADIRADIYSLGSTLYFLLTGRPPFEANSLYDIYKAHISRLANPLNLVRPAVPAELAALVTKMMAKDPALRFQTPGEVAQAIAPFFKRGNSASRVVNAFAPRPEESAPQGATAVRTERSAGAGNLVTKTRNVFGRSALESRRERAITVQKAETPTAETMRLSPPRRRPSMPPPSVIGAAVAGLLALGAIAVTLKSWDRDTMVAPRKAAEIVTDRAKGRSGALDSPEAGLLAFYSFDDGTAQDLSGRGNHGLFGNLAPVRVSRGFEGAAFGFDPNRDTFITIPVDINPSSLPALTMGGWLMFTDGALPQAALSHDDGDFDRTLGVDTRGGDGPRWSAFVGAGVLGGSQVVAGRWTFLALRHDQATGKLTLDVDGQRFTREGVVFGSGFGRTTIGKNPGFDEWFSGLIDNVFIYDGVLCDSRIDEIRLGGRAAIAAGAGTGRPRAADRAMRDGANGRPPRSLAPSENPRGKGGTRGLPTASRDAELGRGSFWRTLPTLTWLKAEKAAFFCDLRDSRHVRRRTGLSLSV